MRSQGLDLDSLTGATTNDACGYHYLIGKSQTPTRTRNNIPLRGRGVPINIRDCAVVRMQDVRDAGGRGGGGGRRVLPESILII